jgi:hypothetical protein
MKISKEEHSMDTIFTTAQRIAASFLRISLGVILL